MRLETKHTQITEELHRDIISGRYQKKLPPLRSLMKEYNVSLQTISKAIRPLTRDGVISPGPRGSVINVSSGKRPRYYSWAILEQNPSGGFDEFSQLCRYKILSRDNHNVILLNANNERLLSDPEFWTNLQIDGLVIGYGALTAELAWKVKRAGIPAIARHYAGNLPVHVVDFATYPAIDRIVGQLMDKGYRRIALQFRDYREGYQDFANRNWDEIRQKHGIEFPEYRENVMPGIVDGRERHTQYLCLKTPPEVILCWHSLARETYRTLEKLGLHQQVKLVSMISQWQLPEEFFYPLSEQNEDDYWEEVLMVLEEAAEQEAAERIFRLVPVEFRFLRELPDKI